jgi:hypothetical protein
MRSFVHWTVAWTTCFLITFALIAATALVRGQLDRSWQSAPGAIEGIGIIIALSLVSGAAIAGIGALSERFGWDPHQKPVTNPILRAALLPIILFATMLLWAWIFPPRGD